MFVMNDTVIILFIGLAIIISVSSVIISNVVVACFIAMFAVIMFVNVVDVVAVSFL